MSSRGAFPRDLLRAVGSVLGLSAIAGAGDAGVVRTLVEDGRFAAAEARAREALEVCAPCSPERPELECLCGQAARRGNKKLAPETLALADHAVALATELFGEDDARTAEPRLQLGILRSVRREWAEAQREIERALALLRESSEDCDPRAALALAHVAIAVANGDHDDEGALARLAEAEALLERLRVPEGPELAWIRDMKANVLSGAGRPEEALESFASSLEIRRRTQRFDHPLLANTLLNVGTLENQAGFLSRAREHYEELLAILEGRTEIAWTLADVQQKLGAICNELGDSPGAQACFERARAGLLALGQEKTSLYGQVLDALARLAFDRRQFESAGRLANEGLAVLAEASDTAPDTLGTALVFAACCQLHVPDLVRASELIERARSQSVGPGVLAACDEVEAWIAAQRGDWVRAHELLAGLASGPAVLGSSRPQVLRELSRLTFSLGDPGGALEESLAADRLAREEWARAAIGLEEVSAISLEESSFLGQTLHPAICAAARLDRADAAERVWDAMILSSDRVFRECAERLEIARARATPELARAGSRLADARGRLASLHVRSRREGDPSLFAGEIARAQAEREAAERDLAGLVDARRSSSAAPDDLAAVRSGLAPGVALVRYCLAGRPFRANDDDRPPLSWERCYFAFVQAGGNAAPAIVEIGSREEIDDLALRFLETLQRETRASEHTAIAAELRRRLLDPVLARLEGVEMLLVVPEGRLCFVPFSALASDRGVPLAETGPLVHFLGSEQDLLHASEDAARGSGLLALGDPDFGSAPHAWPALPHTRAEIGSVAASFERGSQETQRVTVLAGQDATERELRLRAPGRRVVHLATHGYYEEAPAGAGSGSERGLPAGGPVLPATLAQAPSRLPFLRSGLVLASGGDDGILTAEEVLGLDLTGVEWIVLSACDTGLGELRGGEGVLGLRRAFRMAGARTVIASLWPVEDRWAREWMAALYRARFEQGRSTAQAVREASLAVRALLVKEELDPLPRRWASFVAVGDWR